MITFDDILPYINQRIEDVLKDPYLKDRLYKFRIMYNLIKLFDLDDKTEKTAIDYVKKKLQATDEEVASAKDSYLISTASKYFL